MPNMFSSRAHRVGLGQWLTYLGGVLALAAGALSAHAQTRLSAPVAMLSYADIADLVQASSTVATIEVRSQALVEPARALGVAPGHARLYVEARTQGLLWGRSGLGEQVAFLADVPLLANGKPPKLKKQRWVVFGALVPNRPGTLQLAGTDAYFPATASSEQLTRTVIAALAAPDAPPRIKGVRDVMSVAGNLTGESETQLFVDSVTGAPVALTVVRRPGMAPRWGVSWSEIVDESARPPEPDTVGWYRLACFLPAELPQRAYLQPEASARARAAADYRVIIDGLGPCRRTRA
ncbi:MAG: hypothetical protein ABIT09_02335 [Croceibacterium sp.]